MAKESGRFTNAAISQAAKALNEASRDLKRALTEELGDKGEQVAGSIAASLQKVAQSLEGAAQVASPGGVSSARAEKTKQALIEAAAKVIAAKSYEGASVGDIAEQAGFTKGAIYAHFGSKEELFMEVARSQSLLACAYIEESDTGGRDFVDWYADRAADAFAAIDADDDNLMLFAVELASFALRHPEYRAELARYENDATQMMARRIAQDRTGKRLGPDDEVPREDVLTAIGVAAISTELLIQYKVGTDGVDPDAVRELIRRIAGH